MRKVYSGENRREISFPIGGIGAGCIGLDGTGRLVDWEIFNHPDKGTLNGFSHFGIKVEKAGKTVDARVLNSDLLESYTGRHTELNQYQEYGFGPNRALMCGVPHFHDAEFVGTFPMAEIDFLDEFFPGKVCLKAFNPFIPSNDKDSSIPGAFFTLKVTNITKDVLLYTSELTVNNPAKYAHIHRDVQGKYFRGIELGNNFSDLDHPNYGSVIMGVPAEDDVQVQHYWFAGNWFDSLGIFWQDFTRPGRLNDRMYDFDAYSKDRDDLATLAVAKELKPGETWEQRFLIGWYYPNCINYWSQDPNDPYTRKTWKNYYGTLFSNIAEVAEYSMHEWTRMEAETTCFCDALYSSSLPEVVMEAVGANLSVLKSPTVLRLTNGEFYGWEGCLSHEGACDGSCTHVWNYAHALPFLFPRLERSMRELDYTYNLREDGSMAFRLLLPLGRKRWGFRPCVDGQMGGIIKMYREWKLSGDDEWLRKWWPSLKKALEFAWAPSNRDRWDPDKSGVISGRQHHTLDMELFGPNSWLNSFYIGALKAASEMAKAMGEPETADQYYKLYEQGRAYTDKELFNGKYYIQKIDIRDQKILEPYSDESVPAEDRAIGKYWNNESGQIKYQIANGCIVDQVLGQWMCELAGVGEILDEEHVKCALQSIYKNNFKSSLRFHFNPCRIFGLNDESGLTICDWPEGVEKPVVPVVYAEEIMTGFEYQAASHMIRHGLEEEGLRVVKGIRDRYDGKKRNPWNEMECGSNYARSMASYALLLVYSGFTFDLRKHMIGFKPRHKGLYFWSVDGAWGTFCYDGMKAELKILYGALKLAKLGIPKGKEAESLYVNGEKVPFAVNDAGVAVDDAIVLGKGADLTVCYSA